MKSNSLKNQTSSLLVNKTRSGFEKKSTLDFKWSKDVENITLGFKKRITKLVSKTGPRKNEFNKFLHGLRQTLKWSVDKDQAIEMLAQHLITKPVFEALFDNYSFVKYNPVSQGLESLIEVFKDRSLKQNRVLFDRLYKTVKEKAAGIKSAKDRQQFMVKIFDNFFKLSMPLEVKKLGIVYTPIEIVDFIINSVSNILKKEFKRKISDKNVYILDPFTGIGTFITRLIESGLLGDKLPRKYKSEIKANEIVLLAYHMASLNIENAYHAAMGQEAAYQPFNGLRLTDTFGLYEKKGAGQRSKNGLKKKTQRMNDQKKAPIQVIFGNPPYAVGQGSAKEFAPNQSYPALENKIINTYMKKSTAQNKAALYDSYVKAFRFASDRLKKGGGIIAFVSNAGWLEAKAMDGMRKCLAEEFSKIYVFNLRGNCRTSGEIRQKEAGNVFGQGCRASIGITILVKNPNHKGPAEIFHHDIGDYLNREQKLNIVAEKHDLYNPDLVWEKIEPNPAGDWLNQRSDSFMNLITLGDKKDKENINTFFKNIYSNGLNTSRDPWCYNYSAKKLQINIKKLINFYNNQVKKLEKLGLNPKQVDLFKYIDIDRTEILLKSQDIKNIVKNKYYEFSNNSVYKSLYRPFNKQNLYFNKQIINNVYFLTRLFPTKKHKNLVICVSSCEITKEFSCIISNIIPDSALVGKNQCFPRYHYEEKIKNNAFSKSDQCLDDYIRHDAITDYIYQECEKKYGQKVSKDDIFYYVYGLLHSEDYRREFSLDLKKVLPRLPLVKRFDDFKEFSKAGRKLAKIHLNYETVKPYAGLKIIGQEKGNFLVDKARFVSKGDKTTILYNRDIIISGIPLEAYDYLVNGKSALEWILERYQVKVDKKSGLKNDPNDWARELGQPSYLLDLILRVITVSLETVKIVKGLPKLSF
jgi:predicted helicase